LLSINIVTELTPGKKDVNEQCWHENGEVYNDKNKSAFQIRSRFQTKLLSGSNLDIRSSAVYWKSREIVSSWF